MSHSDDRDIQRAAALVARASSGGLVALTGAGISTDSGIRDFRGPNGVWTTNPAAERLSTLDAYLGDEEIRRAAWQSRLSSPVWAAQPTAGHRALVELERLDVLSLVITQNTDGLHLLAGHQPERVIEIHGTAHWTECWSCRDRLPTLTVLERVRAGEADPRCTRARTDGAGECGGILKTATVSFGQSLDREALERASRAAARAQVLLAVGTTLEVQPVAGIVPLAKSRGTAVVIVNGSPTALDSLADVVVRGSISEVLPQLVPVG
ncbi:MAG: SIR2 family NAD-dependent protein deacylase [Acidimicrobiales bacterium]